MNTTTTIETLMMQVVSTKPDAWLNCHGDYIGEALALQCKGLIDTRITGHQLQIRMKVN